MSSVSRAILELAENAGSQGMAMGTLVDRLEGQGFSAAEVETEIWHLLERRRLTPCGFVCRTIRRRDGNGEPARVRMYEFMLVPWSVGLDQQLELHLDKSSSQ
jgi:hypothetical protein